MAVLQGDPGTSNLFTVRLRFPDGYKIAPHTHPTDEYVTVVAGTFRVGMGKKFETKGMLTLNPAASSRRRPTRRTTPPHRAPPSFRFMPWVRSP